MDRPCLCDQLQPMMRHPVDRLVWLEKMSSICAVHSVHSAWATPGDVDATLWNMSWLLQIDDFYQIVIFLLFIIETEIALNYSNLIRCWALDISYCLSSHKGPPTNKPIRISLVNPYKPLWMGLIGSPWVPFFLGDVTTIQHPACVASRSWRRFWLPVNDAKSYQRGPSGVATNKEASTKAHAIQAGSWNPTATITNYWMIVHLFLPVESSSCLFWLPIENPRSFW